MGFCSRLAAKQCNSKSCEWGNIHRCDENYNKLCSLELVQGISDIIVPKGRTGWVCRL